MRALQIVRPREFRIVEIEPPPCGEHQIVVKLEYAAICNQNDYKIFYGLYGDLVKYPCDPGVYGHEGVGVVVEAGSAVTRPRVGERVVMMLDGGPMLYRELVLREADSVAPIAPHVPPEEAAVLELFGCAHHCLGIAGDLTGREVAISGLGPAGLALLQMATRRNPRRLIGVEPAAERGAAGRRFGMQQIVNPTDPQQLAELIKTGVDLVIDATGVPAAILNSFEIARHEVIIFGFTNQPFQVDQSKWFQKELVIKNSKVQTIADLRAVVRLREAEEIDTRPFVSGVMSFAEYDRAVEKVYRKEAVKILLRWE